MSSLSSAPTKTDAAAQTELCGDMLLSQCQAAGCAQPQRCAQGEELTCVGTELWQVMNARHQSNKVAALYSYIASALKLDIT